MIYLDSYECNYIEFETDSYVIILRENVLEIDLKEGIKAFLEYLVEEHNSIKRILGWVIEGLFPRTYSLMIP